MSADPTDVPGDVDDVVDTPGLGERPEGVQGLLGHVVYDDDHRDLGTHTSPAFTQASTECRRNGAAWEDT